MSTDTEYLREAVTRWPAKRLCVPDLAKKPLEPPTPYRRIVTRYAKSTTFPFMSLPAELRNEVYAYYLGPKEDLRQYPFDEDQIFLAYDMYAYWTDENYNDERTVVKDPLVQVSRQIRLEFLPLLIRWTEIDLRSPKTLDFLGSYGLSHLTTVCITGKAMFDSIDPPTIIDALTTCPNLRHLSVRATLECYPTDGTVDSITEAVMATPEISSIMKIKGLDAMIFNMMIMIGHDLVTRHRLEPNSRYVNRKCVQVAKAVKATVEANAILPRNESQS